MFVCRSCSRSSFPYGGPSEFPRSADADAMTYLCIHCCKATGPEVGIWVDCSRPGCRKKRYLYPRDIRLNAARHYCGSECHGRDRTRLARVDRPSCKWCGQATAAVTRRARDKWNKGRFCSKACGRSHYLATHSTCHGPCGRDFTHRQIGPSPSHPDRARPRPRYCSRACLYQAQRVPDVGLSPSARRISDAYRLGVRGSRALARAAHASTKTVYKVADALGLEIGSDAGLARSEVAIGDLRVAIVTDEGYGPPRRRPEPAHKARALAWRAGQRLPVQVLPGEWVILERLTRSPGEIVTSEDLLAGWIGRRALAPSNRSLATYVAGLRRKLGVTIKTAPGIGYRLEI